MAYKNELHDIYFFDEPYETFNDEYIQIKDCIFEWQPIDVYFDTSLIKYVIQPENKIKSVNVDRQADLIWKKGQYIDSYLTIEAQGVPQNINFQLLDENNNQLYSPFNPDGEYVKYKCQIKNNETSVIPLPADYATFNDWVDFEPGIYNWKLVAEPTEYYDGISIDIQVEIRDFNTWEPVSDTIMFANDLHPIVYRILNCFCLPPEKTDLLTKHATYNPESGEITYPVEDLDTSTGVHIQPVGNRVITYEIKHANIYLIDISDNNGDIEITTELENNINSNTIGSIELDENTDIISASIQENKRISNLKINQDGDLIFNIDTIEQGD